MLRRFFNYLPLNNREKPPVRPSIDPADRTDLSLDTLVPDNPNKPYDIKELIRAVADGGDFLFERLAGDFAFFEQSIARDGRGDAGSGDGSRARAAKNAAPSNDEAANDETTTESGEEN